MLSLANAFTEDEVASVVGAFLASCEGAFPPGMAPFAVLTTVLGPDCAAAVIQVGAAAVQDLEAESAATGGNISERAANRITRNIVQRVSMRAGRRMAPAPRVRGALRVRSLRRRNHRDVRDLVGSVGVIAFADKSSRSMKEVHATCFF